MNTRMHARPASLGPVALVGAAAWWGSAVVTTKLAARGLPTASVTVIEVAAAVALLGGRRPAVRRSAVAQSRGGVPPARHRADADHGLSWSRHRR
jgi:hypothetical protein